MGKSEEVVNLIDSYLSVLEGDPFSAYSIRDEGDFLQFKKELDNILNEPKVSLFDKYVTVDAVIAFVTIVAVGSAALTYFVNN